MTQDTHTSNWLRVLLSAFFSRMRFVLLVSLACAVVAWLSSYLLPEVYTGNFAILIKSPEIDQSIVAENADITVRPGSIEGNVISDEYHILRSEGLAKAVAKDFGSDVHVPRGYLLSALPDWTANISIRRENKDEARQQEALGNYLLDKLIVTPQLKSDIITVTMDHHDKYFLQKTLSLYASTYLNYRNNIWFNTDAHNFFSGQANTSLDEWRALSEELLNLKSNFHKIDPNLERAELEKQIVANLSRLQALQSQIDQHTEQLVKLNNMDPGEAITFFSEETKDNRLFWQLKIDIGETKAKRQELLKDHMEASPLIQKVNLQLDGLYKEYKRLTESLIRNTISMLKTEQGVLIKNNESSSARMLELDRIKQQVDILGKKIKLFEQQYEVYESKAMTIDVQSQSHNALGAAVRIISPPSVRSTPIWPNRTALVMVAAILGFFLTLIAVVSVWMMKDTFHFPEDVASELGLPVLTSFPLEKKLYSDVDSNKPRIPPTLSKPKDRGVTPPSSRPMGYALLVFVSMSVAGWIIGTTLWPVLKDYRLAGSLARQHMASQAPVQLPSRDDEFIASAESTSSDNVTSGALVENIQSQSIDHQATEVSGLAGLVAVNGEATVQGTDISDNQQPLEVADTVEFSAGGSLTESNAILSDDAVVSVEAMGPLKLDVAIGLELVPAPALTTEFELAIYGVTAAHSESQVASVDNADIDTGKVLEDTSQPVNETEELGYLSEPEAAVRSSQITIESSADTSVSQQSYFLQFGSFRNQVQATALRNQLLKQGYVVRMPTITNKTSGDRWYSVRADFDDIEEATKVRDDFLTLGGTRPVLGKQ